MTIITAISMIEKGISDPGKQQHWADLGAGNGMFTKALSSLLTNNSRIYAVDTNTKAIGSITSLNPAVTIHPVEKDFTSHDIGIENLNGIIMANSLHYVSDPLSFLQQIKLLLQPGGRMIIIEYDTEKGNTWVPYPISFVKLEKLCEAMNVTVVKIAEQPSLYRTGGMYAAVITT